MASFKKISAWVTLSFIVVTFQNCAPFESPTLESANGVNQLNFFKALNENVITPKCLTCHSGATPAGGKNFSSYDTLLASEVVLIGNPTASTLYTIVANPTDLTHAILDDVEISALEDWILAGAEENVAPVVNAGRDINVSLPLSSVRLVGQASDKDGLVAGILWTIQSPSGSPSSISNSTTLNASLTNLVAGTYQITLSVTDDFGDTTTDTVSVVVAPAGNIAPRVDLGAADRTLTLPTNMVALMPVTASDTDGDIVSYLWTQDSGPSTAQLAGATTSNLIASNLIQGAYVFRLTVTDNSGATANDTVRVIVNPVAPAAPTYTELNQEIFVPLCVGCHGGNRPSGGYNMSTYNGTRAQVRPGNAQGSGLYTSIITGSMPPVGTVTQQQRNKIRDWINAGALNN